MAKCKHCGITTGPGKRHKDNCPSKAKPSKEKDSSATSSGGMRIDGRTSIPILLKWQTEIETQLKKRPAADVREVKKAIDRVDDLRAKLKQAEADAGL